MKWTSFIDDLLHLFYPETCRACGQALFKGEEVICTFCLYHLPRTQFHTYHGNKVEKKFWGKTPVKNATALFYFSKGMRVQKLVHQLKYNRATEVGTLAGNLLGNTLKDAERFKGIDVVVPVPLHISRLRTRGYNQSAFIAAETARCLGCPYESNLLYRAVKTDTQTKKHRYERWENVGKVFRVNLRYYRNYRHILLVDDVITTGSTLAACADVLIKETGAEVSIAAMAVA